MKRKEGDRVNVLESIRNFKGKTAEIIAENKPHRRQKEKRTLPVVKKTNFAKGVIWTVIICVSASGVLGFMRAQNALGKSKGAQVAVAQMKEDIMKQKEDVYTSPKLEMYANRFVDVYINVPKENREKRQEELSKLYAKGLKVDEQKDFSGYRKLNHKVLYDVKYKKGYAVLQYKVAYENIKIDKVEESHQPDPAQPPIQQMVEKEHKVAHNAILNIPIGAKDGKYAVVENPYMTAPEELQAKRLDAVNNPLVDEEEIEFVKKDKLERWLKEFFAKYADSKSEDMKYMMKEPKGLNGIQQFVRIDDTKVYAAKQEDVYIVKTNAIFKEKELDLENKEVYTLKVKLKDDKYFIEKMEYTLGGNE